jgi:hypothetical protein
MIEAKGNFRLAARRSHVGDELLAIFAANGAAFSLLEFDQGGGKRRSANVISR